VLRGEKGSKYTVFVALQEVAYVDFFSFIVRRHC